MRIHELVDTLPADTPSVYICHAPDGICKVLAPDGCVYDHPDMDVRNLAPAIGALFDSHWRGANAQEIAAHPWNGPRVMRTNWTDPAHEQPPADDAFVAVGALRFDGEIQTEESLDEARIAWGKRQDSTREHQALDAGDVGHATSLLGPLGASE